MFDPRPLMGSPPPQPPLSEAQASETLRQHGYLDGSRQAAGAGLVLRIDRDGHVTPR